LLSEIDLRPVARPDTQRRARMERLIMQPGETRGSLNQTTYQVICIHSGEAFIRLRNRPELHLPAGHSALLRPRDLSHRRTVGRAPSIQTWVAATPDALSNAQLSALDAAPATHRFSPATERLHSAIADVSLAIHAADDPSAGAVLLPLVVGALMLYAQDTQLEGPVAVPGNIHPAVIAAQSLVRQKLDQPLGLSDLAAAGRITPAHLVRLFRRDLATTPIQYLRQQRLRADIQLIGHSDLPIAEVVRRVGFQSASHFSHAVRHATRLSPTALRRRAQDSAASPIDTILVPQ
jgi:AraC-like DNA-binding protein